MEIKELLKRYTTGERDFRKINLIGASLIHANLPGVNFAEASLAGANLRDRKSVV